MKKIKSMIALLLVAMMFIMPLQAAADRGAGVRTVQRYNSRYCTKDVVKQAGLEIVRLANERIEQIIDEACALAAKANCPGSVDAIIVAMLVRTSAVSIAAQVAAEICGVKTVCEYVEVTIGGRTVLVDPLRVVLV